MQTRKQELIEERLELLRRMEAREKLACLGKDPIREYLRARCG